MTDNQVKAPTKLDSLLHLKQLKDTDRLQDPSKYQYSDLFGRVCAIGALLTDKQLERVEAATECPVTSEVFCALLPETEFRYTTGFTFLEASRLQKRFDSYSREAFWSFVDEEIKEQQELGKTIT